jgi:DNA polymerase-3 subunit chi
LPEQVYFIILNSAVKDKVICDLAEKCYMNNKRVAILVKNNETGYQIDKLLWIWKQHSFVPHIFAENLSESLKESVIITSNIIHNSDYDVLLAATPPNPEILEKFSTIIDFAEKYDSHALEKSRNRFREYKKHGMSITSLQPGEFLHSNLA